MKKLEILYPRSEAKIYTLESNKEKEIFEEIDLIKNSYMFKVYEKLLKDLENVKSEKPRFICGKCNEETKLKDLTLYNFISYSDTIDEDKYNDYNIICPKCGYFNYLNVKDRYNIHGFDRISEIT